MAGYMSGWLAPDGEFTECGYMEHAEVANEIKLKLTLMVHRYVSRSTDKEIDFDAEFLRRCRGYISMGQGYVALSNADPTPQQVEWVRKNVDNFDNYQRELLLDWIGEPVDTMRRVL